MRCPKCPKTNLDSIANSGAYAEPPMSCATCGGVWVSLPEMPRLMKSEAMERTAGEADVSRDANTGMCPNGHGILSRARLDTFSLERCTSCYGVWFDRGEWQRLAGEQLLANLPEIWDAEWQKERRRTRGREKHLEGAREDFGDELFARLTDLASALREHPRRSQALAFLREESQ